MIVNCPYVISPWEGIRNRVSNDTVLDYSPTEPISNAMQVASLADVAIVFVSVTSSEGIDRPTLSLPQPQDDLIRYHYHYHYHLFEI